MYNFHFWYTLSVWTWHFIRLKISSLCVASSSSCVFGQHKTNVKVPVGTTPGGDLMCRYASYGGSSPISDDDDGGGKFVFVF